MKRGGERPHRFFMQHHCNPDLSRIVTSQNRTQLNAILYTPPYRDFCFTHKHHNPLFLLFFNCEQIRKYLLTKFSSLIERFNMATWIINWMRDDMRS